MGMLSWVKKIKVPKMLSGAALVGLGWAASQVPGLQGIGADMIKTGGAVVVAGVLGKGRRIVLAPKGEKLKAATAHERVLVEKLKKSGTKAAKG